MNLFSTKFLWGLNRFFCGPQYDGLMQMAPDRMWRVIYDDGKRSMLMDKGNAFAYASIFAAPKVVKELGIFRRTVVNPFASTKR